MRRFASKMTATAAVGAMGARFQATKKYDLFGYEVSTETAPWIEKIKKVKTYDEAGELLVQMNVKNCPPDLQTYNATLQAIFE